MLVQLHRAPDKVRKLNFNRLYLYYFFTKSYDDSNKWLNIGFGEEIGILENKKRSLSGALGYTRSGGCLFQQCYRDL